MSSDDQKEQKQPTHPYTDGPLKCTWHLDEAKRAAAGPSPHAHKPLTAEPKILSSILDHIGNTPLVRINKISESYGLKCELLAKCEFFNAGGSVRGRIRSHPSSLRTSTHVSHRLILDLFRDSFSFLHRSRTESASA